jgi:hypothetical protein
MDLLDDNPAAGADETGAGGMIGSFSAERDGDRWLPNRGAPELGGALFPRIYAGEPDALRAPAKSEVLYPAAARFRAVRGRWRFGGDLRFAAGRIEEFETAAYFDNPELGTYDRIRIRIYEELKVIRYRLFAARALERGLVVGVGLQYFHGIFQGDYSKLYDHLGPREELEHYSFRLDEDLRGNGLGLQLGVRRGSREDELQWSVWISTGSRLTLEGPGRWRHRLADELEEHDYRQELRVEVPPELEATVRRPLPWLGWGAHAGLHLAYWGGGAFQRRTAAMSIPEPSWKPAVELLAGLSYMAPSGLEAAWGYRFQQAAGTERGWPHSLRPEDLHRLDGYLGYSYEGFVFALSGGLGLAAGGGLSPDFLEVAGVLSYVIGRHP